MPLENVWSAAGMRMTVRLAVSLLIDQRLSLFVRSSNSRAVRSLPLRMTSLASPSRCQPPSICSTKGGRPLAESVCTGFLAAENLASAFGEIPGNPLLGSADVRRISPLLKQHGIPLVADDVVASPVNVDLGRYADLTATSLTKYIAGTCDVMGGALICNPRSPLHAELKGIVQSQHEELLWGEDALVLSSPL